MAQSISTVITNTKAIEKPQAKALSFTEEYQQVNKIKYGLSLVYFAAVATLMTTLII